MKYLFSLFIVTSLGLFAQNKVKITINGLTPEITKELNKNQDRISCFIPEGAKIPGINLKIELLNETSKSGDIGRFGLLAIPDKEGNYSFKESFEVKLRKIDTTKLIQIKVTIETIFGDEIFTKVNRSYSEVSQPITLDKYMWREGNEKIKPERKLCLEFSTFVNDPALRNKIFEKEGKLTSKLTDFQLFLKQNESDKWQQYSEPIQAAITNGNALKLTSNLPLWLDPTKKIFVRFSAKTPLGNYIWDEYVLEPSEFRKEQRARFYTGEAFDKNSPLK